MHFIDTREAFEQFLDTNRDITRMAFDTEFIGEFRLIPKLCLIQVLTDRGIFLLDTLRLRSIKPFLQWIEDPNILKITHAGNNDYALLHSLYNIHPKNIFDVQIAAGFVGMGFPLGFQKLIKEELGVKLDKSSGITNWDRRPLTQAQLAYATDDVRYLFDLWERLRDKLRTAGRLEWAEEEFELMLKAATSDTSWREDFIRFRYLPRLTGREIAFTLKLFQWRDTEAHKKKVSKDLIIPLRVIIEIVKNIKSPKHQISNNRILARKRILSRWDFFRQLAADPQLTEEERRLVARARNIKKRSEEEDLRYAFLKLMLKQRCYDAGVSETLTISGIGISNPLLDNFPEQLTQGWRGQMLGPTLVDWMRNKATLNFEFTTDACIITRKSVTDD